MSSYIIYDGDNYDEVVDWWVSVGRPGAGSCGKRSDNEEVKYQKSFKYISLPLYACLGKLNCLNPRQVVFYSKYTGLAIMTQYQLYDMLNLPVEHHL